jgi:hypothetical protein
MPIGRPTKYNDAILEKALNYVANYEAVGDLIPTSEGLACELDIARSTIYKWADEHPAFSDMLDKLNSTQARRLQNGGLGGTFQPTIAKLILAKHGYHETHDQNVTMRDYTVVPADESLIDAED